MKYPKTFVFVIVLLCFSIVHGQDTGIRHFDNNAGLSNNSVITIFQDHHDYMWFGTYDGLNKYDGYEFKVYRNRIGDTTSLIGNTIYCIAEDSKGNLWVGGALGASILNDESESFQRLYYKPYNSNNKLQIKDVVHQINKVSENDMLVATQKSGLIMYKNHKGLGVQVPLTIDGKIVYNYDALSVINDKNNYWVAVRNLGICKLAINNFQCSLTVPFTKQVYCIYPNSEESELLVGTDEGLFLVNTISGSISKNIMPVETTVTKLLKDKSGVLWITTDGDGVYTYTPDLKEAIVFKGKNGNTLSSSNSFFSIYEDNSANLWFGSLRAGISLLDKNVRPFTHKYVSKQQSELTPENFILSLCEDTKDSGIWIGTDGAGLKYWNRTEDTFKDVFRSNNIIEKQLSGSFITGIINGNNNDLWVSTYYSGINHINLQTGKIERYNCFNSFSEQVDKNIWFVFKDVQGTIWASATNEGALYYYDSDEDTFKVFNDNIRNLQCLIQTQDGKLWGGNYNEIVSVSINDNTFKTYPVGYPVRSVTEDKQGNLWIGLQEGGLLLFDRKTETYKRYTIADGLPGNTILRILEDAEGNLWMSTYNGLSRFDGKSYFRNFSVSDGLQSNQFSFNAGLKLRSGELVFGGINGFNIFQPNAVKDNSVNRNLQLNGLWLNNKPLHKESKFVNWNEQSVTSLKLPFFQTSLSLEFVSIDFLHPDKIQYAYKLSGWDDNWNYIDNSRRANYSKLLEGDYLFQVKTRNDDGTWGTPVNLAEITVLPPWYRTWWAYLGYVIVISSVLVVAGIYSRNRVQMRHKVALAELESKKEKEMAEQQREMFTYISHEFRTPLSLIIDPLKKNIDNPEKGSKNLSGLHVAHRNAKRLLSLVNQFLIFRKAESDAAVLKIGNFSINALCNEVYYCFVNLAEEKQIDFRIILPDEEIEIYGDYEKLEIALFNLLSNAFKHTSAKGVIVLELRYDNTSFEIDIKDSGSGINAEELPFIFNKFKRVRKDAAARSGFGIGLFVVKYFIDKHFGTITCQSEPGVGSTFTLKLLRGKAHFEGQPIQETLTKISPLAEEIMAVEAVNEVPKNTQEEKLQLTKEFVTDKKSVLIVEDNHEMRTYLINLFKDTHIVYNAENGRMGIEMVEKHRPDIIISDIAMDEVNGIELCHYIKSDPKLNHLPVILLTATSSEETQLRSISEGADDYITKPFDSDILLAKVAQLIKNRKNLRNHYLENITQKETDTKVPEEYKEFITTCTQLIEKNFNNQKFTLQTFARDMGMSHRSLYDKIKQITGLTLNAFIRSVRLRHAAYLLLTEDRNISQIASYVGFEDQRYFRQQFSKMFGMTPSEYIKKYKSSFNKNLNVIKHEELH